MENFQTKNDNIFLKSAVSVGKIVALVIIVCLIAWLWENLFFGGTAKTNRTIRFINSQKITLDDVMGKNLPPVPDQKLNDSTIAGIDANKNNIRDDVELAIFKNYPNSAKIRAAELQYAQETQMELGYIYSAETWMAVIKNKNNGISCLADLAFGRYHDIKEQISKTQGWQEEVVSLVFNTNIRQKERKRVEGYETAYVAGDGECNIPMGQLDN